MFDQTPHPRRPEIGRPAVIPPDHRDDSRDRTAPSIDIEPSTAEQGFSLTELLIAVAIIAILSVAVIGETLNAIEKARLAACMANMVSIRESVWANCDGGMDFPDGDKLWNEIWRAKGAGGGPDSYWYELDNDDPNKGHGNDLDGFDEQNPGKAPRVDRNIYFVLACEHDHGLLADFVYLEDDGSPRIYRAASGEKRPIWYKFYRKDHGPGGGKKTK